MNSIQGRNTRITVYSFIFQQIFFKCTIVNSSSWPLRFIEKKNGKLLSFCALQYLWSPDFFTQFLIIFLKIGLDGNETKIVSTFTGSLLIQIQPKMQPTTHRPTAVKQNRDYKLVLIVQYIFSTFYRPTHNNYYNYIWNFPKFTQDF